MTVGQFEKTLKKNLSFPARRENFTEEQLARVAPDEKCGVTPLPDIFCEQLSRGRNPPIAGTITVT
jgi:hypothetical protein